MEIYNIWKYNYFKFIYNVSKYRNINIKISVFTVFSNNNIILINKIICVSNNKNKIVIIKLNIFFLKILKIIFIYLVNIFFCY